jgi:hypothetical protein
MFHFCRSITIALFCIPAAAAGEPAAFTFEEADFRLRHVYALARETNDSALVDRVLELRDAVRRSLTRKDLVAAERLVRDAEEAVGLDPGGKTMFGLRVAWIDPALAKKIEPVDQRLAEAMAKGDSTAVAAAVEDKKKLLGELAGLPDVRRKGDRSKPTPIKSADVADIFIKAIQAEPRALRALSSGVAAPDTMPRAYASVAAGCLMIRPLVEMHHKDKLDLLDGLVHGCCKAMIALQTDRGHFKFPDLRGKHLVLGDAMEKIVEKDPDAVRDGWLLVPFPDGSSQVDAAECGIALLRAGAQYKKAEYTAAGRKAAEWARRLPPAPAFQWNAYSVCLLCEAHRTTGENEFLDAARDRYMTGVHRGQTASGRWIDPQSARTVHQFAFLRAQQDLLEAMPDGPDRGRIASSCQLTIRAILDEAEKLGSPVTSYTVQELDRHLRLFKVSAAEVRGLLEQAAAATVQRRLQSGRQRTVVPLPELAAVSRVWEK